MYKLTITQLQELKHSLVKSTNILKVMAQTNDSPIISNVIKNNEKQIKLLTVQFYL
jgi:hypothetical protein